jgi:membrane protein implicated in regulation of membrane protease activity
MVLLEGMTLGWFLIILGALLLLVEVHSPGFFAAVPATILIIFGILVLVGLDIFTYPWGIIIAVIVAIVASCVTVTVYSRMTPNKVPTTLLVKKGG